jgi:hypothetical protein
VIIKRIEMGYGRNSAKDIVGLVCNSLGAISETKSENVVKSSVLTGSAITVETQ